MNWLTYEDYLYLLSKRVKSGSLMYSNLLETVIKNPTRYSGIFRLTNAKSKLVQNITQSQEIKFGDFLEDIVTIYLARTGFENIEKRLPGNEVFDELNVDQIFEKDNIVHLVEQKIRDDHDSTKKRGQFENFLKKFKVLKATYPDKKIIGSMWFFDNSLKKNRNYYKLEMDKYIDDYEMHLYYGDEFFKTYGMTNQWNELISHLERYRLENAVDVITIPDFDTSEEILDALCKLPNSLWRKLNSTNSKYVQLRMELFPTGKNIHEAKKIRMRK